MNYMLMLPEAIVCTAALIALLLRMFKNGRIVGHLSIFALILSFLFTITLFNVNTTLFSGFFIIDPLAVIFKLLFISISLLVTICSLEPVKKWGDRPEYYSLMLFTTLGMMITASSGDLITLYIGFELTAIASYPLVAFTKKKISSESAMKYFMFSAFFSAITLFGISLVYGATGSTSIASALTINNHSLALLASFFLISGFGFKTGIVPFHMWLADTHSGAPAPISAFLSGGIINIAFVALLRVLVVAMPTLHVEWGLILAALAILSMTVGNIVALAQRNIKRMFAYSTIAQAGYIIIGLAVAFNMGDLAALGIAATLLHLTVHLFMKGGAFIAVAAVSEQIGYDIKDYAGLGRRAPITATFMLIFLISLAGIVPTAGFISKLFLLVAAMKSNTMGVMLAVSLVINSAISCVYYGRLARYMYFIKPEDNSKVKEDITSLIPMAIAAIVILIIGLYPPLIIGLVMDVANALLL